jgi:monolysocardiolipin acyltransferase
VERVSIKKVCRILHSIFFFLFLELVAGMEMALDRVNDGDWVHIFPEGTRSPDDVLLPMKPGVGRLIVDAKVPPLVIPFYHSGMEGILRKGETLLGVGRDVHVLVGDAIFFDDIIEDHRRRGSEPAVIYAAVANRISARLHQLRTRLLQKIAAAETPDTPSS